jgi:hypothetical protein
MRDVHKDQPDYGDDSDLVHSMDCGQNHVRVGRSTHNGSAAVLIIVPVRLARAAVELDAPRNGPAGLLTCRESGSVCEFGL